MLNVFWARAVRHGMVLLGFCKSRERASKAAEPNVIRMISFAKDRVLHTVRHWRIVDCALR